MIFLEMESYPWKVLVRPVEVCVCQTILGSLTLERKSEIVRDT